jgi:DNA mismatch repair protein MutL
MANRILLLDENTANRIAAGEVVERPASAVKELVENSIDAGATQITVALEEGGKRRVEVADNGCGMGPEDAVLALQRHATSKIRTADDLFAIRTLGFRGEALPSIASVSHLTLTTKAPDEAAGVRITVHGGDIERVEEVGARDGTVVIVEDLFYNTPARLKFLKSTPTELARAVEVVGQLAIAHPQIAFRVRHNGQEVFSTPGSGEPLGALAAVWGRDIARKLIPIRNETPGLMVSGFLCTPDVTRPGRSHELFFVNGRPIRSRLLGHALEDAVRALTPESRYPIAALFVEIAPDLVDVNVHPTKTEVKFTRDGEVHHAAGQAVKSALLAYGIVPTIEVESRESRVESRRLPVADSQHSFGGRDFEVLARAAVDAFQPIESVTIPLAEQPAEPAEEAPAGEAGLTTHDSRLTTPPRPFAEQLRGFRVLGQARNTYILAITDEGIAVIDQHVAHERVLYERLTIRRREQGIPTQHLAVPITLALGAAEAALLRQRLEDFAATGWEIEPFGRDSFLVRSVPSYAARREYEQLLRDMVDELAHQSVARRLIVQRDHVTITNACKMAVKAGDPLTMEEMTGLLEQLADTENPYLCPHGRPIVVTVPFSEIDRRFKR